MKSWLRGLGWLILVGVIWSAAAHPCTTFSDKKVIVLPATYQYSLEDLVPLIVKGIGKEHRHLYFQNQAVQNIVIHLLGVKPDVKLAREGIIWGQESSKSGVLMLAERPRPNHIQAKRDSGWICDLKMNSNVVGHILSGMLPPFEHVYPLPRTPLLDFDLPFKVARLPSYLSVLPQENADSPQGNQNPDNREPQIGTVKRVFLGIVGLLFLCLSGWLLYRAPIADSIGGFFGRMLLGGLSLLGTAICLDSALFDPRIWLLAH